MKKKSSLTKDEEQEAIDLHRKAIVINGLESTRDPDFTPEYFDVLKRGGITAMNATSAWVDDDFQGAVLGSALRNGILGWYDIVDRHTKFSLVRSVDQIKKIKIEGKVGLILGWQNAKPIGDKIPLLRIAYELGIRIIQLTYQRRNLVGDGCGERTDCGLSRFGVDVVKEMNRLGIVIDLSHVGKRTSLDAIEISEDPVIFSHSSARALCSHFRNVDDEQIKAVAEKGGVVGVTGMSTFLRENGMEKGTTVEDLLDHIDYVINIVGADHVGFGLDMDYVLNTAEVAKLSEMFPEFDIPPVRKNRYCMENAAQTVDITKGLFVRGYSHQEIKNILGGNFLRVFSRVW
jgi:membrane dipeptidase